MVLNITVKYMVLILQLVNDLLEYLNSFYEIHVDICRVCS